MDQTSAIDRIDHLLSRRQQVADSLVSEDFRYCNNHWGHRTSPLRGKDMLKLQLIGTINRKVACLRRQSKTEHLKYMYE